jgi:hypothetical protein
MKIVDRKTFLAMPEGTVFSKYEPCIFSELKIKGANCGEDDFLVQEIADAVRMEDGESSFDMFTRVNDLRESVPMDLYCEGRDGLFDQDQLFAVWEDGDVAALISRLQHAQTSVKVNTHA